jgi:two-component system response regulator YesN
MYKTFLVDDRDVFIREIAALRVWGAVSGFHISGSAPDGVDALDCLRSMPCDLVITDIRMPRMDGIDLLRKIKDEGLCPCVALASEYSEFEYARRGIVLGAFDYLVKPIAAERVGELLSRAKRFLEEQISTGCLPLLGRDGRMKMACALCSEKDILAMIGVNDINVPSAFESLSDRIGRLLPPGDPRFYGLCRRVYLNIVLEIFTRYPWLGLYITASRYEAPEIVGGEHDGSLRNVIEELLMFVGALLPAGVHGTLRSICDFILENPDSKINLQVISEKFFINRTYLSNIFHQKTGLHLNKYITLVKLSRARFLLENSNKKIYEISYGLGYNDFNYFNKIYKKFSGNTPSESRQLLASLR